MNFSPAPTPRFDPVAWWARVDGSRTALIEATSGRRHSYAALDAAADRWSALLSRQNVAPGDRVAVLSANRAEFIAAYYGCVRRGAMLVPLNWRLAPLELARVLADCAPTLLLGASPQRGLAEAAALHAGLTALRWLDFDHDVPGELAIAATAPHPVPVSSEDPAMLLYTSGSSGAAKGVVIPHRQILWNAIATTTAWQLGGDDVGPASTPFFHTGGWNVFTTPLLFRGGAVVLIDGFDPDTFLDAMSRYQITVSFGVPAQLAMLRTHSRWGEPLPKLRWFISGGAPCAQQIKDAVLSAGYRMREGYGLTECGPNCFATNDATAIARPGTVGWPVPFLDMRLTDGEGTEVPSGEIGELELRGAQLFGGYFRAPERTAEVMTDDGWFRTGDLASRDPDGIYAIRGRRKEMFISGGENVFPGEVEAALLDCAGVSEVCVLGVPDSRWGEVGCALVVREATAVLDAPELVAQARLRLAAYKVPRRVLFIDAIPRLGSGKVDRRALAALIPEES